MKSIAMVVSLMQELRRKIQEVQKWDVLDKPIPRTYGPAGASGS